MTVEIQVKPYGFFDGETLEKVINNMVKYSQENDEYSHEIVAITQDFDNGFAKAFFQSEIERVQKDLDVKLSEAEQEYYNQLEEEDWREQEIREYWDNR
tara:strand:- start:110 stop:406 length:297 start_codon:yes stop_codon:yes gene_type:complete